MDFARPDDSVWRADMPVGVFGGAGSRDIRTR
jgi:hypothetical protein